MKIKMKHLGLITVSLPTSIKVSDGIDLAGLIQVMKDEYGNDLIEGIENKSTFLVNKMRVDKSTTLRDGDEVMILSVLGGG